MLGIELDWWMKLIIATVAVIILYVVADPSDSLGSIILALVTVIAVGLSIIFVLGAVYAAAGVVIAIVILALYWRLVPR